MKRTFLAILPLLILTYFTACTRIDTTDLGNELIPAVDNVNTFDMTLDVTTDNLLLTDTVRILSSDDIPVGEIFDDPEFGQTVGNAYFTIYPSTASKPQYPFYVKDSVKGIDSVVFQVAATGIYGDSNSTATFRLYEIAQSAGFKDSSYAMGTGGFATAGLLASKTLNLTALNDSQRLIRKRDTTYVTNVLRFRLDNSFGDRLLNYDTTNSSNGGYRNDSIFATLLRGFALTIDSNKASDRALTYFNISDEKTRLLVYYRVGRPTTGIDTTVAEFRNSGLNNDNSLRNGIAASIRRNPGHGYATYLSNGQPNDDRIYIQSSPGSYALLTIPGLDTLANKVIHRAEVVLTRIASTAEDLYTPPQLLFMDMITSDKDSAFTIQNDFLLGSTGGANFTIFGGTLRKSDGTYRFNISRHVQGIITRKERNYQLRIYAPYLTRPWYLPPGKAADYNFAQLGKVELPIIGNIAAGREVLHGGAALDPAKKVRLYIVYSKI